MRRLVPDFILRQYAAGERSGHFAATALLVDISGFSQITERLMQLGQYGAEVLATLMRTVFDPMVHAVQAQRGFITNFAGDAFTAVFAGEAGDSALRALAAAQAIQEALESSEVRERVPKGFHVSGKVAVATGDVSWGIVTAVGGHRASYYFQGSAVEQCISAEKAAHAGDLLLTPDTYELVKQQVAVVPAGGNFRVTRLVNSLPKPGTADPDPQQPDPALVRDFFPETVIASRELGEFRSVLNVFISLPAVRTKAQLRSLMQRVFALEDRYGGLLNRLDFGGMGAHLLLFWGAPVAHENDVSRALGFVQELQAEIASPISGAITYRLAHAGFIGGGSRGEYTCYGPGINLAARFVAAAPPGEIWVDERVADQVEGLFEVELEDEVVFKGFSQPQKVYVLGERRDEGRAFFQGVFVGRRRELGQLAQFVAPLTAGQYAGVAMLWGEPGIGKSRLVHTFEASAFPEGAAGLWAICQTDEILRESLNPFRYWLKQYFNIRESVSEGRNKRQFNRRLNRLIAATADAALAAELDRVRAFFGALVGLRWPDSLFEQLDAQGRYENTFIALTTLLQAESLRQPIVVVIEDAQWLDEDSLSFLPRLTRTLTADAGATYPVAILLTGREKECSAKLREIVNVEIVLDQLDREALAALATERLQHPPSPVLLELLVRRAEGNPFFAEQILRYLRESGLLALVDGEWRMARTMQGAVIPTDVRAVLVARLDRLTEEVKRVVQTAAVLGREFELRVLAAMLTPDGDVRSKVTAAEEAGVWTLMNEVRYIFRHTLMRDAAYRMQVRARRERLHALAVAALERLYENELPPRYGEIAYHAERAGLTDKARHYLVLAGDVAQVAYQNDQAAQYYSRALALAYESGPRLMLLLKREQVYRLQGARRRQKRDLEALEELIGEVGSLAERAEISLRWAAYWESISDLEGIAAAAKQALRNAQLANDTARQASAYLLAAQAQLRLGKTNEAIEQFDRALTYARAADAGAVESECLRLLGMTAYEQGDHEGWRRYLEQALAIHQQAGSRYGEAQVMVNLGYFNNNLGYFREAERYLTSGLVIAREIGARREESIALANLAVTHDRLGERDKAWETNEQAIRYAREVGDRYMEAASLDYRGELAAERGEYQHALRLYGEALSVFRELKAPIRVGWTMTHLGELYINLGDFVHGEGQLEEAVSLARQFQDRPGEGEALNSWAWAALLQGDYARAQTLAEAALAAAEASKSRYDECAAAVNLADALAEQGRAEEATALFARAMESYEEMDLLPYCLEPLAGLARLALAVGDLGKAAALVARILPLLKSDYSVGRAPDALHIVLTCAQVLLAAGDPHGEALLAQARALLEQRAASMTRERRRQYLEQIPAHRVIMRLTGTE